MDLPVHEKLRRVSAEFSRVIKTIREPEKPAESPQIQSSPNTSSQAIPIPDVPITPIKNLTQEFDELLPESKQSPGPKRRVETGSKRNVSALDSPEESSKKKLKGNTRNHD